MRRAVAGLLLILVLSATWAMAETPKLLTYQGKLYDSGGQPVTGSHAIIFSIYTAESGGSLLWRESHPSLAVSEGIYSVVLGQDVALDLDLDQALWLGVTVDADNEMTPRTRLTPAPQALWASGAPWQGVSGKPGNVIHVAKTGGDFASIQAALDSISDASATNPYLVLVGPGVFAERVALKPYVHVQGAGQGGTIIQAAGGGEIGADAAVVEASAGGELSRATLRCSSTSEGVGVGVNMSNASTDAATLRQVDIEVAGSIYAYGVVQYGGSLTLEDVNASADASNTSHGMILSGSEASLRRCKVTTVAQSLTNGALVNAPVASLDDLAISVTSSGADNTIVGLYLIPNGPPSPVSARGVKVAVSAPINVGNTYGLVVSGEARVSDAEVEVAGSGLATAMRLAHDEAVVEGATLRVTAGSERVGLLARSFRYASDLNVVIGPESETSGESWAGVKISDDEEDIDFDANHGILSRLNLEVNCSNCEYARGLWADEARGVKVRGADISVSAESYARGVEATTSVDGFELSGAAITVADGGSCHGVHFYQSSSEAQNIGMSITDSKVVARDCDGNYGIYLENCLTRLGNVDISAQGSEGILYRGLYTDSDISTASTLVQGCRITSSHTGIYDWVPSCSGDGCHQDLLVQGSRIQGDVYAAVGTVGSTIKLGNNQIIGILYTQNIGADFLCSGNYDENMDAVTW